MSEILTSWKEIAAHFGKGVRTVQRWEKELGLPVRRPQLSGHANIIVTTRQELDAWFNSTEVFATALMAENESLRARIAELEAENEALRALDTSLPKSA